MFIVLLDFPSAMGMAEPRVAKARNGCTARWPPGRRSFAVLIGNPCRNADSMVHHPWCTVMYSTTWTLWIASLCQDGWLADAGSLHTAAGGRIHHLVIW